MVEYLVISVILFVRGIIPNIEIVVAVTETTIASVLETPAERGVQMGVTLVLLVVEVSANVISKTRVVQPPVLIPTGQLVGVAALVVGVTGELVRSLVVVVPVVA